MRDRPFISADGAPRPYSEIVAERTTSDVGAIARGNALRRVEELEGAAAEACGNEAKRLLCEAEDLRCALDGK